MPRESRLTEPLPWYPWQPLRWQADRLVQKLSWAERGLLRELQDECYLRRSIPADLGSLAYLLAVEPSEIADLLPRVLLHFESTEKGRLISPLIEGIRSQQDESRLRQSIRRLKIPPTDASPSPRSISEIPGPGEEETEEREEIRGRKRKVTPKGYCPDSAPPISGQEYPCSTLPCSGNGPKIWPITKQLLAEWGMAFPGVDLPAEVHKMRLWLEQNPKKRKTFGGMPKFTLAWLTRAQDWRGSTRNDSSVCRSASDLGAQLEQITWNGDGNAQ